MKLKKIPAGRRLLSEGWFESEAEAKIWIMLRRVICGETAVLSFSQPIPEDGVIRVKEYYKKRFVSKGGLKLEGALDTFGIDVTGKVALDCGASTGGFTDCLLSRGAAKVYAVDAGHSQLAAKLAADPRVINCENTNISDPSLARLEPAPSLITLDLSYLSLRTAVPVCRGILRGEGELVCLIKPIFETASASARREGNITDPGELCEILISLSGFFAEEGFAVLGLTNSPVTGNGGALEFFAHLVYGAGGAAEPSAIRDLAEKAVLRAAELDRFKK